jgi:poly(hydroxyalkanoate) depolymerase family esterase
MFNAMMDTWSSLALSQWSSVPFKIGLFADPVQRGEFSGRFFEAGGATLRYKLFIPSSYAGRPVPLIVMLHGCGQDADDFASGTGMNELAERMGCIVAYPEQSLSANRNRCWNWFDTEHHHRGRGEPALIAGITREILREFAIDRSRVCVAGLSAGGAMAVILGRTYHDLFTAVGCHSGLAHGSAKDQYGALLAMRGAPAPGGATLADAAGSVPVIVFHGDMDGTVHVKNSASVVQQSIDTYACTMRKSRSRSTLDYREETGHASGRRFTRVTHCGRRGKVIAEHWTVHGAGHAWSGGHWNGSCTDSNGPSASEEMVRFFMEQ